MVIAGDANVWLPYFSLGRSRSVDNLVVPFIDLLISSCGLINPPDQASHVAGAALDLMLISSHCPCSMLDSGLQCCVEAPGCCSIMGSDHYLCVASSLNVCSLCAIGPQLCAIGPQLCSVLMVIFAPCLAECSLASKAPLPIAPHSVEFCEPKDPKTYI